MPSYAQTNLQLFNQAIQQGYCSEDLQSLAKAYRVTIELFTGMFRPSGKTFVAHLVGTASILMSLNQSVDIVIAGLLHAAYANGDFGLGGQKGIAAAKQSYLQTQLGNEIESYVEQYTKLKWDPEAPLKLLSKLDQLDQAEKDVILIRLANELEEYLDFGMVYNGFEKSQRYSRHDTEAIKRLAEELGFPNLAQSLVEAIAANEQVSIPLEACNLIGKSSSSLLLPKSLQLSPFNRLSRFIRSQLRKVYRAPEKLKMMFRDPTPRLDLTES
ncbi:MAG: HD domain-containing protein [Thermostichus sp. BF3_bins_97]